MSKIHKPEIFSFTESVFFKLFLVSFGFILIIFDIILRFVFRDEIFSCNINEGVAFGIGIFNESIIVPLILLIIAIYMTYLLIKKNFSYFFFSFFIFAFGLINYVDRLIYGGVCDYFKISYLSFNLADVGISLIIVIYFFIIILDGYIYRRK